MREISLRERRSGQDVTETRFLSSRFNQVASPGGGKEGKVLLGNYMPAKKNTGERQEPNSDDSSEDTLGRTASTQIKKDRKKTYRVKERG